jgi:hypothetical protein
MMLVKVVALLCTMALCIAFFADCAIFACGIMFDSFSIASKPSGWVAILSMLWFAALVVGCVAAKHFQIFPFIGPK